MTFEILIPIYLLSSLAGLAGLVHLTMRTPLELKSRRFARAGLALLMFPVTGIVAGGAAAFYWARFVAGTNG